MLHRSKSMILDSWAVIAYFGGEVSSKKVADLLVYAHENDIALKMSMINAGEVWYSTAKQISESHADDVVAELGELGIELIEADWAMTRTASSYKSKHRMSFADCFAAALAKHEKAELVERGG